MLRFMNVGYGNSVNGDKVIAIVAPEAAPIKRLVQQAKDEGRAIDATCGRKTRAVITMENGSIVLSALLPETLLNRYQGREGRGEEDE